MTIYPPWFRKKTTAVAETKSDHFIRLNKSHLTEFIPSFFQGWGGSLLLPAVIRRL